MEDFFTYRVSAGGNTGELNVIIIAAIVIGGLAWILLRRENGTEVDRIRQETSKDEFLTPVRPTGRYVLSTGCLSLVLLGVVGVVVVGLYPWMKSTLLAPGGDINLPILLLCAGALAAIFGVLAMTERTPNFDALHPSEAQSSNLAWGGWFLIMAVIAAVLFITWR